MATKNIEILSITVSVKQLSETSDIKTVILSEFEKEHPEADSDILRYPAVYVFLWKEKKETKTSVYIGESTYIMHRIPQHIGSMKKGEEWQNQMGKDESEYVIQPVLNCFFSFKFSLSLTRDIENQLMNYAAGVSNLVIKNERGNPQKMYAGIEYFEAGASRIWKLLHEKYPKIFPVLSKVEQSIIYRASPHYRLTEDQTDVIDAAAGLIAGAAPDQDLFIMVEGHAGTGKTVLVAALFETVSLAGKDARLVINHKESYELYSQMFKALNMNNDKKKTVEKPVHFLDSIPDGKKADVVIVDEGHLLYTQGGQGHFNREPQIRSIKDKAKVTVLMYDSGQMLDKAQYPIEYLMDSLRNEAKGNHAYFRMTKQLRMQDSDDVVKWIDEITENMTIPDLYNHGTYEVEVAASPDELEKIIQAKNQLPRPQNGKKTRDKEYFNARMIATYDWEYGESKRSEVCIPKHPEKGARLWVRPWNYTGESSQKKRKGFAGQPWMSRPETIGEVGSVFSIQGFDLDYAGLIIGPAFTWDPDEKRIRIVEKERANQQMWGWRTIQLENGRNKKVNVTETIAKNELYVLMTRGTKGLFIYACDPELQKALKNSIHKV